MKQRQSTPTKSPSVVHEGYTKGIEISQCSLGSGGDLSLWEFSGHGNYYMFYDHFIGNTNCIHTVVFNLEDDADEQLEQVRFWLNFLQSRIPPVEPLGKMVLTLYEMATYKIGCFSGDCGRSSKPARIVLVATHADLVNCNKNIVGEYASHDVDAIVGKVLEEYGNFFNIHAHVFIIDANSQSSPSLKGFKTALTEYKKNIIEVN